MPADVARQVDEYRAFCLYALGRATEAESVAESLFRREPLTRLDATDLSPRLEMMFSNVRKRLLPLLIRERFQIAKTAFNQKNLTAARPPLIEARLMIAEAAKLDVKDDGLADLSVLVDGFLELVQTTADAETSRPTPPISAESANLAVRQKIEPAPPKADNLAAREKVEAAPAASAGGLPRAYTVDDAGVTPPVVLNQSLPAMTSEFETIAKATNASAVIDIVIDERGDVLAATVRRSLNSTFDDFVLRAARHWKYRPAMKDGIPVRYIKTLLMVP
jgi:TonB family protein